MWDSVPTGRICFIQIINSCKQEVRQGREVLMVTNISRWVDGVVRAYGRGFFSCYFFYVVRNIRTKGTKEE